MFFIIVCALIVYGFIRVGTFNPKRKGKGSGDFYMAIGLVSALLLFTYTGIAYSNYDPTETPTEVRAYSLDKDKPVTLNINRADQRNYTFYLSDIKSVTKREAGSDIIINYGLPSDTKPTLTVYYDNPLVTYLVYPWKTADKKAYIVDAPNDKVATLTTEELVN